MFIYNKMSVLIVFVCLTSFLTAAQAQLLQFSEQHAKLRVTVLYESLCPDSIRFITYQLQPNFESFKDFIDVTLVPFGKSRSVNNGQQFTCQHGPAECEGNRLQSCVLQQSSDQSAQIKFVTCQMNAEDASSIKYCAESVGLSSNIDECFRSEIGTQLQLQAEQITKRYAPSFVPTIVYDDVFDQRLQNGSIRDFRGIVCAILQQRGTIPLGSPICA